MICPAKEMDRDKIAKIALKLAQYENDTYRNKSADYDVYKAVNHCHDEFMGFCIGRAMVIYNIMQD